MAFLVLACRRGYGIESIWIASISACGCELSLRASLTNPLRLRSRISGAGDCVGDPAVKVVLTFVNGDGITGRALEVALTSLPGSLLGWR